MKIAATPPITLSNNSHKKKLKKKKITITTALET